MSPLFSRAAGTGRIDKGCAAPSSPRIYVVFSGLDMGSFRSLSADDVRGILRAFGAPAYRGHRPIAVGTINTNLAVETEDGPRFLRVNEGKSEDDVAREAAIVAHAAAGGVPTPAPARAPDGRSFVRWALPGVPAGEPGPIV